MINVSFDDVQAYVEWLSKETGKKYRLPTEAEWEYAAKAGSSTAYWWGDGIGHNNAVCRNCGSQWNGEQTVPVGSFSANAFELYGTAGNVREWTKDCWHKNYQDAPVDGSAWLEANGGECDRRVVRGGAWLDDPRVLRSADRGSYNTGDTFGDLGFRIVRGL